MRILQLHSNFIVYKPVQKEIAAAEQAEKKEVRLEELLVLFTGLRKATTLESRRRLSMRFKVSSESSASTAF